MEVSESTLHKQGQLHYHVLFGRQDIVFYDLSIDDGNEALNVFLDFLHNVYPGYLEPTDWKQLRPLVNQSDPHPMQIGLDKDLFICIITCNGCVQQSWN